MKPERLFYTAAGAIFLVLTVIGFRHYIFEGRHFDGSPIDPSMLATVIAHSSAIFAWFVLFFVQSLLIATKNRRLHMKLGWGVLVIASAVAVTGPLVATRSIRLVPQQTVFDWPGPQFLLVRYTEIALFVVFVATGVLITGSGTLGLVLVGHEGKPETLGEGRHLGDRNHVASGSMQHDHVGVSISVSSC